MKKSRSTKQKILSIALKEFAAYGFGGARVERIARQAGVNKAMIFYYSRNSSLKICQRSISNILSKIRLL